MLEPYSGNLLFASTKFLLAAHMFSSQVAIYLAEFWMSTAGVGNTMVSLPNPFGSVTDTIITNHLGFFCQERLIIHGLDLSVSELLMKVYFALASSLAYY
uniref:Uncharacterized protein n=1 Tax=Micrurus spixii TaxID=129469 RepID=A0A2D4LZE7_9SAUR